MHFVYKLDKLFRSIRVSEENSSVRRALQCFLNLFELRTSFVFSMQHSKHSHQFPTCSYIICCFSVIYLIVQELNDREIENHYKMNSGNVETWHGIIISPSQHVRKSREGHGKNWMHFVYKLDNLFRISRFRTKTHLLHQLFKILITYYNSRLFAFIMHYSKPRHQLSTLSDVISYF